ncbi:MAG TPA: transposase family protein [Ktedonobacteraceae bacterium]|jgi:transposase|nr:transposase family protein [Ktedonobacteraceae bacterium]
MSIPMIFLPDSLLEIDQLIVTEEGITLVANCTTKNGSCPTCQTSSSRVHSHYQRTLKDLPASGLAVQWKLNVRRFFCENSSCSRKTFAEALPEVAARSARKTVRLTELLRQLGFALGGEAGAHIATVLNIACSADTFLRLVRKTSLASHPTPRI